MEQFFKNLVHNLADQMEVLVLGQTLVYSLSSNINSASSVLLDFGLSLALLSFLVLVGFDGVT